MSEHKNDNDWASQLFTQNETNKRESVEDAQQITNKNKVTPTNSPFWINQLFEGKPPIQDSTQDKLQIIKNSVVVYELNLREMLEETILGRHPLAEVQLESSRIAMFHVAIIRKADDAYFIQDLGSESGSFLNGTKLVARETVRLRDGYVAELPDYYLKFSLPNTPALEGEEETIKNIVNIKLPNLEPPKYCPLMSHLIEEREKIEVWSKGTTLLRVADIIDETLDTKTFRLVSDDKPLLFSYQPGQFVTLLLDINGQEIQRSYSMSSSPSRPHTLELTVKRVPNGLVSNWLCDQVKLGTELKVKGPSGKFTCFHYPSNKIMFLAAGSGITPVMSMARWITDTTADIDVKFLASFKTPSEIIFRKELELMSARHGNFRVALTVTSSWQSTEFWTGFTGRISPQMIQMIAPDFRDRHIFMCGPDIFMDEMKEMLKQMGFPMINLHSESFGVGRIASGVETRIESKGQYQVKFTQSGLTVNANGKKSILDIAEENGIEIDYSCRSGYCGDCKVKARGNIKIPVGVEIDEDEKQQGFVYACCCFPQGNIEVEA